MWCGGDCGGGEGGGGGGGSAEEEEAEGVVDGMVRLKSVERNGSVSI